MPESPPTALMSVHEFRVGSVLGRSLAILMAHVASFLLLSAVALLPFLGAMYYFVRNGSEAVQAFLMAALSLVLQMLCTAVILHASIEDMRGQPVHPLDSVAKAFARLLPILGLSLCTTIATLAGFLLVLVPGFVVLAILFVALPACLVERRGPIASMVRSADLTRGHRWQLFGLAVVMGLAKQLVDWTIPGALAGAGGITLPVILSFAWATLWVAYQSVITAVVYHDLRALKEGIDIDHIAAQFD